LDAVFATVAFPVATSHHHGVGHRAMDAAMQGVGGLIATSPLAQCPGAPGFTLDNGRHDEGQL
jgi:hypothetical protein